MDELHKLITELTCGDDQRAESVVPQLVSMGGNAIDVLIPLLGDSRSDTRWWALRVLAEISDSRIPPLLTQSLTDIDPEVRQCATLALRLQPDPQAVPRLISSLSDEDAILAYLAAHPGAADTAEGIANWWLAGRGRPADLDIVSASLDFLARRGDIEKVTPKGSVAVYRKA